MSIYSWFLPALPMIEKTKMTEDLVAVLWHQVNFLGDDSKHSRKLDQIKFELAIRTFFLCYCEQMDFSLISQVYIFYLVTFGNSEHGLHKNELTELK